METKISIRQSYLIFPVSSGAPMTLARLAPKEEEEEEEEEDGLKAVGSTCRHIKQQVFLPPEVSVPSLEVELISCRTA